MEVESTIAVDLSISDQEQSEVTKSGQSRFRNQVAWARFYLVKAGLLTSSERGVWSLTEAGRGTDLSPDTALLLFRTVHARFQRERSVTNSQASEDTTLDLAPEHAPEGETYQEELLSILRSLSPPGFERLCQRLLRESGFEEVTVTGRSGDGGIDGHGVLQVNPFVSFRVLFQCKRYGANAVGAPEVRDFRGAMTGRTDKGIILTTGSFTADAKREAIRDGAPPIELVDGEKLISMFEQLRMGLKPIQTYELDRGFFQEFQQRGGL